MTSTARVNVVITTEAKGSASKQIAKVSTALDKNKKSLDRVSSAAGGLRSSFDSIARGDVVGSLSAINSQLGQIGGKARGVTMAVGGLVAAGVAASTAAVRFTKWSVAIEQTRQRLDLVFGRGKGLESAFAVTDKIAGTTVPAVLELAQVIKATGVQAVFTEKRLTNLVNRAAGHGKSGDEAFNKLTEAMKSASAEALKDIGIYLSAELVLKNYAISVGKTTEQLTQYDKQNALASAVVRILDREVGELTGTFAKQDAALAKLNNAFFKLKLAVSGALATDAVRGVDMLASGLATVAGWADVVVQSLKIMGKLSYGFILSGYKMSRMMGDLALGLANITAGQLGGGPAMKSFKKKLSTWDFLPVNITELEDLQHAISKKMGWGIFTGSPGGFKGQSPGTADFWRTDADGGRWEDRLFAKAMKSKFPKIGGAEKRDQEAPAKVKTTPKKYGADVIFGDKDPMSWISPMSGKGLDKRAMSPKLTAQFKNQQIDLGLRSLQARLSILRDQDFELKAQLQTQASLLQLDRDRLRAAEDFKQLGKEVVDLNQREQAATEEHNARLYSIDQTRAMAKAREVDQQTSLGLLIGRSIADQIEHEKARAGLLAIISAAEAYRNLALPVPNVAGFVAAMSASVLYARAAAGGGSVGKPSTAGAATRGTGGGGGYGYTSSASGGGGGSTTIVTNYNGITTTKQQLAKQLASTQASAKNTGI
jgi:hypothetical protein